MHQPKRINDVFWAEVAPCEHMVQIYEEDDVFLDALEGYVIGGLRAGDSVVIIATEAHQDALDERLKTYGVAPDAAEARGQYIRAGAEATLDRFMVNGWPDEELFAGVVSDLLLRARRGGRRVRAFGEMVALLWAQGHSGATVRLEHLWHAFCQQQSFSLFCAYPRSGFTRDAADSIKEICSAHSRVISA